MIDPAWEKELMWAAGFWDGEGCCSLAKNGGANLSLAQRHPEVLERFRDTFQVGNVSCSQVRGKPLYKWSIQGYADVRFVRDLLISRVSPVKKKQFEDVFSRSRTVTMKGSPEYGEMVRNHRLAYWARKKGVVTT